MNVTNNLIRELISKKKSFRVKSIEHERTFKECSRIINTFHAYEVNPNEVKEELNRLCFKLEMYSLDHKAKYVKSICETVIQLCDDYLDKDNYLLSYSILMFLIDIHGSLGHGEYEGDDGYNKKDCIAELEIIDWGHLLRYSDDIVALTRDDYDYDSDESSEISYDNKENVITCAAVLSKPILTNVVNYDLVTDCQYSINDIEGACYVSLQSEYWMDSSSSNSLSSSLFLQTFEQHLSKTKPEYYQSEIVSRVSLTEYQFVREVLDVLMGARNCSIWKLYLDSIAIVPNRYHINKDCKLSNLSWAAFDNINKSFATLATYCLHLRIVSSYIIENSSRLTISPPLIAFGETLYAIHSEFSQHIRKFEDKARGNIGLTVLELHNALCCWTKRLVFLDDLIVCITSNRFDSLQWHSTVVSTLDLLYNLMNESCLLDIDPWTVSCIHRLFFHCFQPYLFSLDALLCGQTHLSSTNLFLDRNESVSSTDIRHYYEHNFTIRKTATQSLVSTIPLLLHPFIVPLISTITSIDILRLLSIELSRPTIVNGIVKEPGSFTNHFNITEQHPTQSMSTNGALIRGLAVDASYQGNETLFGDIYRDLVVSLERTANTVLPDAPMVDVSDLVTVCRRLHRCLQADITDRYMSVNGHLMSVYVDLLGLGKALDTIRSVHFLQGAVEMYELCSELFTLVADRDHGDDLTLRMNLKLQQVLADSNDTNLRKEAMRLVVVRASIASAAASDCDRMMAALASLSVQYDVAWPLRLFITEPLIAISNRCLRFLLQLRFAKHCLESAIQSQRSTIIDIQASLFQRRMVALRLKLLQIVNSFHLYVMNTFLVPSWTDLDAMLRSPRSVAVSDLTDLIGQVQAPFSVMARGCLQTDDLARFHKAISLVCSLGVKAGLTDPGHWRLRLDDLETDYRRLVDFFAAMFKGLSNMGITINGLDISAFR